jgi:hypothetical protein
MSNANRVSADIPAAVITDVTTKLNEVRALLQPYLQALTPEERRTLPKMSDKSIAFVNKAEAYSVSNPEFAPAFMQIGEFSKDMHLVTELKPILDICEQLASNIDDTSMLAGSEAYVEALMYYNGVKLAAKTGQASARPIYDDLSMRFPGATRRTPIPVTS